MNGRRRRFWIAGPLAAWVLLTPAAAEWGFEPSAEVEAEYDSNVLRTGTAATSDLLSRLQLGLEVEGRGRHHRFAASYRPVYESYLENEDLNNLSHLATLGWQRDGPRAGGSLSGSYSRSEDPRLFVDGSAPLPQEAPFLVSRSRVERFTLQGGFDLGLSARTRLDGSAAVSESRREDPELLDSETLTGSLGVSREAGPRVAWRGEYRATRFEAPGAEGSGFHAGQGGGALQATRSIRVEFLAGAVVAGSGALDEVEGSDRLIGNATVQGDHRRLEWSLGLRRGFSSSGGLTTAFRSQSLSGGLTLLPTREDRWSLQAFFSENDPVGGSSAAEVSTRQIDVRYGRDLTRRWSLDVAVSRLDQDGEAAAGAVLDENRVTVGVGFSGGRQL